MRICELHTRISWSSYQSRSIFTKVGKAANTFQQLIKNLRAVFECLREAGLKLSMAKCHFEVQEVGFLGRTITTKGVAPQKQKIANFFEKTFIFPRSKKALQRYIGFSIYYRNSIRRLAERFTSFLQLLETRDAEAKTPITPDFIKKLRELNEALDRCCQLALRQPLPGKQLVLMTDVSFQAAGYALLIKNNPNQKYTSTRKITILLFMAQRHTRHLKSKCPYKQKNFQSFTWPSKILDIYFGVSPNQLFSWPIANQSPDYFKPKWFPHPYGVSAILHCSLLLPLHTFLGKRTLQQIFLSHL